MAKHNIEDLRNIALVGHGSSGKTTVADKFLTLTGTVNANPSVDDGTSICDFDEEEKQHKYSIEASVTHFEHAGKRFHVIDTPGYPDLIGQAIGALRGVDTAAIFIEASAGIKVNTRRVFQEAAEAGVGRVIVISKMDAENIDFPALLSSIKEMFGNACVPLNVPLGQGANFHGVASTLKVSEDTADALVDPAEIYEPLIESIIEVDEAVMERYFEGTMPSDSELSGLIIRAVASGTLIPILCVSGKTGTGVPELLDALASCALPPTAIDRKAHKEGDEVTIKADASAPLAAQVFKTRIDPFVQKLNFIRIYSGTLKKDSQVPSSASRKGIKIGPLLQVQAGDTSPIDQAGPGDIVAVAKLEDLHTGDSLGEVQLPEITFPTPMVGLAVQPKSRGDEAKLSSALHKICEEDPTVRLDHDQETKELVINGMSELHLKLIQERLKRRDKVEVNTKEPKIPYRETIQADAEGSYRHKKQSGGSGQFAEVHIRMHPFPEGTNPEEYATKDRFPQIKKFTHHPASNFLWVDSVVGGSIPGNFMPAVEKGFLERINRGVVAGYKVQNVCVDVHFGKDHPVDSNETAFRTAASNVFREVFEKAKPSLLEPIVKIHVTIPGDKMGDVNSDMSTRRGRVLGMESAGGDLQTVIAEVPLAEVSTYARALSSMTGGQGSYVMEFSHYDVVPPNIQQQIIAKSKVKEDDK
ncbi:MAG: elongation factor G [Planctomycetales bacterium]|nr:elongation factor G [Planctomycetales bacterium]NIM09765.1 elongation factor G [Planctomycetales bacterium]NIN09234.1 elongation factor G [Planctomycetales bacterium]NIN78334.1 elongation factor G [Planctomycetales bacterium]NIO35513.1 elongation factor G [Planctomycetales bacterium]